MQHFADWLAATALSTLLKQISWIVPTVQTIHILFVAITVSSAFFVNFRVLGLFERSQTLGAISRRFLPSVWYSICILLLTGAVLIIAEPDRALTNPGFAAKLTMLLLAVLLTIVLQRPLRQDAMYWERSARLKTISTGIAALSLTLWSCIVFAGRWIAYL